MSILVYSSDSIRELYSSLPGKSRHRYLAFPSYFNAELVGKSEATSDSGSQRRISDQNKELMGWLKRSDLLGTRWLASANTHAVIVKADGEAIGSIRLENPHSSIEVIRKPNNASYRIKLNVTGTVQTMYKKVGINEMKRLTEETLRKKCIIPSIKRH